MNIYRYISTSYYRAGRYVKPIIVQPAINSVQACMNKWAENQNKSIS